MSDWSKLPKKELLELLEPYDDEKHIVFKVNLKQGNVGFWDVKKDEINSDTDKLVLMSPALDKWYAEDIQELVEENNELKKESYGNLDGLETYKSLYHDLSEKFSNLEADYDDLKKENEQLKKLNTHLKNELSWIKDYAYWKEKDAFNKLFGAYMETCDEYRILVKENEQLKKEYNSLQRTAYKIDAIAYDDREYSERLYKQNQQLEKESKELKNKLAKVEEILNNRLSNDFKPVWNDGKTQLFIEEKVGYRFALEQLKKKLIRENIIKGD